MASDNLTGTTSVVNLLSTDDALVPPSRARTPTSELDPSSVPTRLSNAAQQSRHAGKRNQLYSSNAVPAMPFELAEQRLERELVRSYLHNLHYLHPMLDSRVFSAQCEEVMWAAGPKSTRSRDDRHFIALYNIVVAVGALVSSRDTMDDLGLDIRLFQQTVPGSSETAQHSLLRNLSRKYFQKSRAALGDVFEACSLESAQTLLLMSLYCQNFLKPHACYMYSGMAVRTALAIGLPTESISSSVEARKAARRTWWCIYSHESDMSCSSGRRDSLAKPRNYPVPFPRIKGRSPEQATLEDEDHGVAMINEMVHFAVVLRRISKEIYHNTKGLTMLQKSNVANQLDALLLEWKSNLPEWLNFEVVTFCGTEMAAKQKLVLHLRYLNARIILHRPFLADFHGGDAAIRKKHVDLCVDAARETIRVLYSAYASLPYFRTWWYNSTYSLYAGMIILYAIMLGHTSVPSNNLVEDVKKSRDILRSMEEASVARRSADLMSEVLDMARAYSQRERSTEPEMVETGSYNNEQQGHQQSHQGHPDMDELFSREYFQNTDPGQDPEALLASLIESNMLQDFTAADVGSADLDFSMLPTYGDLGFLVNDQYNGLVPIGQGFG
ncbi:uncharacterized protein RCC_01033 [Ramularia collo-cygni]|uniref:Xylanolytic transcriptional activator regulatory domain-containing protein n=1 Tax=Ramularia collo-cygni TaxID=112498 RepID=A0A2D3UMD3_9PEZI|nr:uncharacterized protein RCC_01033 [Ramularia collo-cygni]CZT15141.1 uncharacterized protein RCC_01033 [Ramularia collo-cygni]